MGIQIITPRQIVETKYPTHSFKWTDDRNSGFSFDVEADGRVKADMDDAAAINYYKCLTRQIAVVDEGFEIHVNTYNQPAIGRCHCGEEVSLGRFTNTCGCGRDYNSAGQLLAAREDWGEETGETASDVLNGGY